MTKASDSPNKFTAKEQAAMTLKVPNSGTDWLDEMIEQARELDQDAFRAKLLEPTEPQAPQGPKDPPKGGRGKKVA